MKNIIWTFLILSFASFAQQSESDCNFTLTNIGENKYQITINNFDKSPKDKICFLEWINTGKNKPDGELTVFDGEGNKRILAIYQSERRIGTHYYWYKSGELECEKNWETDHFYNCVYYYKSGKIKSTAINGNRDNSIYTSYYENGQTETLYDNSNLIEKTWHVNGQLKSERSLSKKKYTEWYSNGQIKVTGSLDLSGWSRIGEWYYYHSNGKLTRELFYESNNGGWYGDEIGWKNEKTY